jgi:hypothetical protein
MIGLNHSSSRDPTRRSCLFSPKAVLPWNSYGSSFIVGELNAIRTRMFYCKRVAHQLPVQHETLHLFPKRKISSKVDAFSGYEFCIYYFCIEEDPEKYKI